MHGSIDTMLAGLATQLTDMAAELHRRSDQVRAPLPAVDADRDLTETAERLLRQRQARKRFLPPSLFHEPAWELLLSLFVAYRQGTPLNVKHLVSLVDAPVTTSQRWIDQLVHMKLIHRVVDPADRRRLELSLTETAAAAMEQYLASIG